MAAILDFRSDSYQVASQLAEGCRKSWLLKQFFDDGRRTTYNGHWPITIAHLEHFVVRWAKKLCDFYEFVSHIISIKQKHYKKIPVCKNLSFYIWTIDVQFRKRTLLLYLQPINDTDYPANSRSLILVATARLQNRRLLQNISVNRECPNWNVRCINWYWPSLFAKERKGLFCAFRVNIIWAVTRGSVPTDMCAQRRIKSPCASAQSDHNLRSIGRRKKFWILGYQKCAQWRFWSGIFRVAGCTCPKVCFQTWLI